MDLDSMLPDQRHRRLVEWLCTPKSEREPKTQEAMAESLGVSPRTLRDWKSRKDVRAAWSELANEVIGDPDNVFEVVEQMRKMALDTSVRESDRIRAANLYLEVADAIKPPEQTVNIVTKQELDQFSDAELDLLIAQEAAKMKQTEQR